MKKVINISIYNGSSKKDNKPFKAIKLEVGQYSHLIFDDPIRIAYVENYINSVNNEATEDNAI